MKNKILRDAVLAAAVMLSLILILCSCSFLGMYDDGSTDGDGDGNKETVIISCEETDMTAGKRIPITVQNNSRYTLYDDEWTWSVVGDNTVELTFEHEEESEWTNGDIKTYVRASMPGKVTIQAVNDSGSYGKFESNILELTFVASYVHTADELKAIAGSELTYMLGANIDLSGESDWTPIEGFKGTLMGNGFSISNLTVNVVNVQNIGLFGTLEGGVKDLKIEDASVVAKGDIGNAGIVCGTNKGKISGVTVSGMIDAKYYENVGGVAGYSENGIITGCTSTSTIIGADRVGGIVGGMLINTNDAISSSVNNGEITGKTSVGGIAGYISISAPLEETVTYTVQNNINRGVISGDSNVGGVFGEVEGIVYEQAYRDDLFGYFEMSVLENEGSVFGATSGENVGGLIGKATKLSVIKTSENIADVTGGMCVGGYLGYAPETNIKANEFKNTSTITGKAKVGGFAGHAGVIENAINEGEVISNGVLVEEGKSHAYVGGIAGYCMGIVGCKNDSDITVGTNGAYVGGIAGYVEISVTDMVNGNVNNGEIYGADCVGGIAGYLTSAIIHENITYDVSNCENNGHVLGANNVGGIFGEVFGILSEKAWSDDCFSYFNVSTLTNHGDVTGDDTKSCAGGLIGKGTRLSVITTCDSDGSVTGGSYVGGYVGCAPDVNIKGTGAIFAAIVTGRYYVGGFAGQAGIIEDATNSGEIVCIGHNDSGESYVGGIAGYCTGIIGCTNNSDIENSEVGTYLGGIAGFVLAEADNTIRDNVNNGSIIGTAAVGGIAGHIGIKESEENLTYASSNNENNGNVSGTNGVGGIFGEAMGMTFKKPYNDPVFGYYEVINSTNNGEVTGETAVGGIVGRCQYMKTDDNIINTNTTLSGEMIGENMDSVEVVE